MSIEKRRNKKSCDLNFESHQELSKLQEQNIDSMCEPGYFQSHQNLDDQISQKIVMDVQNGKIEKDDAEVIRNALKQVSLSNASMFLKKSLNADEFALVAQNINPKQKPKVYTYFRDTLILLQAVIGLRSFTEEFGIMGSLTSMNNDVVNVLFLAPLRPGCGNHTTATRIKKHFEGRKVHFNMKNTSSFRCTAEFQDYLRENFIHIIIGLHSYHSGVWLKDIDAEQIPYAIIFGGTDLNEYHKTADQKELMSHVILHASALVVFCEQMLTKAKKIWPHVESCRVLEIPQAVDTTPASRSILSEVRLQHHINKEDLIFTLVAGIRPVKDPVFLIQAFSEWHQLRNQSVHLIIVGHVLDSEYANTFLQMVEGCPGILYLGGMSVFETHSIIRDSFALVNSSISEGMCTAILEAMHLEVPVLARNIPGNCAVVQDKQTGLLFSDGKDFVEAAESLITKESFRKKIIKNARTYIELNHDLENERKAYIDLLDTLTVLRPKVPSEMNGGKLNESSHVDELTIKQAISASSTTMNLDAVAEANNVSLEPKPRVLKKSPQNSFKKSKHHQHSSEKK